MLASLLKVSLVVVQFCFKRYIFKYSIGLELLKQWPVDYQISNQLFLQAKEGSYDWGLFARKSLIGEEFIQEIANYCSKDISISFIENKGRGVVALYDIPEGSLIAVNKVSNSFNHSFDFLFLFLIFQAIVADLASNVSGQDFSHLNTYNNLSEAAVRSTLLRYELHSYF